MTNEEIIENIENIKRYYNRKLYDEYGCEVRGLDEEDIESLGKAIKALEQTTWIPCSERLPNHDEYIKNNGLFNVSDGNRSYSEWFDIYDKQMFGVPTLWGFRIDRCVIAWQPLPEPYKGD